MKIFDLFREGAKNKKPPFLVVFVKQFAGFFI